MYLAVFMKILKLELWPSHELARDSVTANNFLVVSPNFKCSPYLFQKMSAAT